MIVQAYDRFESGATTGDHLLQLEIPELEAFLMSKFCHDLNIPLETVDSDIFSAGVDSLQTTRVWNMIKKELDLGGNQTRLSQNVVFERGTVSFIGTTPIRLEARY